MKSSRDKPPAYLHRLLRTGGRYALVLGIAIVWLWCQLALLYHPWLPGWLNVLASAAFGIGIAVVFWKCNYGRAIAVFCAVATAVWLCSWLPSPSHSRQWASSQAMMPTAKIDGNVVAIHNMRRTWHQGDTQRVEHYDQTFDLDQLESAWFGVQYFSRWNSLAHTFVSFGFTDGRYVTISIESRRGKGEGFSPWAGMFRNYGMIYVIGDEVEIIGTRSQQSDNPMYLYPIKASPQQCRAMLIDMLRRANEVAERPEFYDTWTNNCTNNIVAHFNQVAPIRISPYHWRVVLPGYTDRLAYDHGLIDSEEAFDELRQRALITQLPREADDQEEFSERIRAKYGD